MQIIYYPHPALRHRSKPIKRVDAELKRTIRQMFDLMYRAKGIGLAANQVDLPLRLFVVNLEGDPEKGEELVFINPVLSKPKGSAEEQEGCLSLPEVYGEVQRPAKIKMSAFNLEGQEIEAELDGMIARVVQHETDHLDGVLFIDRMSETGQLEVKPELESFEIDFESRRSQGQFPGDDEIVTRLVELERKYC